MPQVLPFIAGAIGAAAPALGTVAFGAYVAGAAFSVGPIVGFLTTTIAGRLLTTVAVSALARAIAPKPHQAAAGIRSERTLTGGTTPASFILGRYATEGQLVAPPMSQGAVGGTPNAYLTYVIELGDIPGQTLESVIINGEPVTLGATPHPDYGLPVEGKFAGYAWIKYYDGTQTAADPMLIAKFGSDPDRPWGADMVGAGICYVVCTFRLNRDLFSSQPAVRFVMGGIPLYDPRLDTSVGGTGPQLWADRATWVVSENSGVQWYNILRGITLPSGEVWGGQAEASDLPLSDWFAAMNAADAGVALSTGGTEPAYRASYEVFVSDEPAAVMEEIGKASSGQIAEVGGVWKPQIGPPRLPVLFITDADLNSHEVKTFAPFPAPSDVYNAVHASYPAPSALWQSAEAPPLYNAAYEADDGGQRRVADLSLPAAPYPDQVQRLMRAYVEDNRRLRRHSLTLPPEAIPLEPLDTVGWTSAANGYVVKSFEIATLSDPLVLSRPQASMRERDGTDYGWTTAFEIPVSFLPTTVTPLVQYALFSWAVANSSVADGTGGARRPALLVTWVSAGLDDISGLTYEVRVQATAAAVPGGTFGNFSADAGLISDGILPATAYEVRLRPIATGGRAADWTVWRVATTADLRLGVGDLDNPLTVAGVPTGLTLSTSLVADARAQIVVTWTASANAVQYEVGATILAGNEVVLPFGETRAELDVLPGDQYSIRVRAVSSIGTPSAWTLAKNITAATDSVAPAVPTGSVATSGFQTILLQWGANTETDLARYEIAESAANVAPANLGGTVSYRTSATQLAVTGLADNTTKYYWIRAVDTSGNMSNWSLFVTATTTATSDFILTSAQLAGLVEGTSFAAALQGIDVVTVLPTTGNYEGRMAVLITDGKIYRYTSAAWSKAVDGVDLVADTVTTGALAVGAATAKVIASNEIITVSANIKNAVITDAKIIGLTAVKITVPPTGTGINPAIEVGTTGVTIGTVQTRAADPAARVNAQTTQINPGLITVSGATTLADWRKAGDLTKIDGGALSANTVTANMVTVGNRNVTLTGITFTPDIPGSNQVAWGVGSIRYINDAGVTVSVAIAAGNATWTTGSIYIYWVKDALLLSSTSVIASAMTDNTIILAVYNGGTDIQSNYGQTVIDGPHITVPNLSAISANLGTISVTNANIANLTVGTDKITWNAVTTSRYASGANDQSITWTPSYSGVATIWLFFTLSLTHSTAATIKYQIKNGTAILATRSFSAIDISPGSETLGYEGNVVAKVATIAGAAITITADYVPGGGTSSGTADLIVLETVR